MFETIQKIFGARSPLIITQEYKDIFTAFEQGGCLFITGKAGSGKSRLIEYLRQQTARRVVVLAPTGLAAINISGQTIHSFFTFPPRLLTTQVLASLRIDPAVVRQIDAIIIDEASMVRADVLDAIDTVLRRLRQRPHEPFGGVQIVLVGDLFQLPPVIPQEEKVILQHEYRSGYFFAAHVYHLANFETKILHSSFRQKDGDFLELLNAIRSATISDEQLEKVNARVQTTHPNKGVFLTTINRVAFEVNLRQLQTLPGKEMGFLAQVSGRFPTEEKTLPIDMDLRLKKRARVLFVRNGPGWVNGSLGEVIGMNEETVTVRLDQSGEEVEVGVEEWDNIVYERDPISGIVEEKKTGTLKQLPLRLAWAVTIHKSQGMTFDSIHIDFSRAPFAHGQTYVALSRCRTLSGISLSRPVQLRDIIVDPEVVEFLGESIVGV